MRRHSVATTSVVAFGTIVTVTVLVAILSIAAVPSAFAAGALPAPVREALQKNRIPESAFSAYVHPLGAPDPLLAFNAEQPRQPASTIKLLTTFAALELLGPAYRWKTEVYLRGPLRANTLSGDLLIKGYGDPFLTTERVWLLLRGLHARGLRDVEGRLLIDNSYLAPTLTTTGAFDGAGQRAYNALPSALMVNFQALSVRMQSAAGRVVLSIDPQPANLQIDNRLKWVKGRCRRRDIRLAVTTQPEAAIPYRLNVSGRYPSGCGTSSLYRLLLPPKQQAYGVIRSLWQQLGGRFNGGLGADSMVSDAEQPFYSYSSQPLAELIRGMNKFSNNVMTRQLLLTLGAERFGAPGTEAKGQRAVLDWLAERGLQFPELVLDNGAGLSRKTRLSVRNMGQMLLAADASAYAPELLASLPLAALDGTLRRRFSGEPLAGRLRLKTGSLNNVEAVAGYLLASSGRRYVVALTHNHPGVSNGAGDRVNDALLRWLFRQ